MVNVTGRTQVNKAHGTQDTKATTNGGQALNNARGTFDSRNTLGVSSGALRNVGGGLGHAATVLAESTRHSRPAHAPVA